MLSTLAKTLAVLVSLQTTLGLATPVAPSDSAVEKRASGYVNAVYFTNWYAHAYIERTTAMTMDGADHWVGAFMAVATSPRTFLHLRSRMFSIHS